MAFRENLHPIVSAAEWDVRSDLDHDHLRMEYQKMVILDAHYFDIFGENRKQEQHFFKIDGPIHLTSEKVKLRDEFLTGKLERRGCKVWHLPYTPPLSLQRRIEMVSFIKEKMLLQGQE
jgi:hypothetical protein